MLAALLALRAAEVRSAGSVRKALEALTEWKPDVLVSDIGMPGEDGYDLIREVRTRSAKDGGQIPAIALTGYTLRKTASAPSRQAIKHPGEAGRASPPGENSSRTSVEKNRNVS